MSAHRTDATEASTSPDATGDAPIVTVEDYRALAQRKLPTDVWDYIDGGAGEERTLVANRRAFAEVRLRPRILTDVSVCGTHTSVLGAPLTAPLGMAPMSYQRLVHDEGEVATARGAGASGVLTVVPMFASRTLEEIAAAATGPLWLQIYWLRRREVVAELTRRAVAAGYGAVVLTVDAPRIGRRRRDIRNGFAIPPAVQAANLDTDLTVRVHLRQAGESAVAAHAAQAFDDTVTWADLAWLRRVAGLPIVLKGVLTAEDAQRAVEHGVDAIVVSNHGGRQLDRSTASLHALVEVCEAVDGACPVLVDGGVRDGTDVFAALALGASAVLVGRPVLWALAVGGAAAVERVFGMLRDELVHTMALAGRPTLDSVDRSAVVPPP